MPVACADHAVMLADLIGLPYRLGARLPGPAADCFGLVIEAFRRRGMTIPDPYASSEMPTDVRQWMVDRLTGWAPCAEACAGCLVEFRSTHDLPAHVGYVLNAREFLHSTAKTGAIVSRFDRQPWASRFVGIYAYHV